MRLLVFESQSPLISHARSIFQSFSFIDTAATFDEVIATCEAHHYEAILVCRQELLVLLMNVPNLPVLVYLPSTLLQQFSLPQLALHNESEIQFGRLTFLPQHSQVFYNSRPLRLRKKELQLLCVFLKFPNTTLRYTFLLHAAWHTWKIPSLNTVHKHTANLRAKLNTYCIPLCITTVYGVGYRLESL